MNRLSSQLTILFIITWINGYTNFQQPVNYRFQYLLIEDGLPQNTINAITKDSNGFMWFGTNNGICRYDGYTFEAFKSGENHFNALPDNMISSIEPGKDKRLWIGSSNGLSYFDPISGSIINYSSNNQQIDAISKVTSMVSHKDELWVGTANNGIFMLKETQTNTYTIKQHFSKQDKTLPSNTINTIYRSNSGELYIGTDNELLLYNRDDKSFELQSANLSLPQNIYINDIYESQSRDLYISTYTGLAVHWKKDNTTSWFTYNPTNSASLSHNTVNKVSEDAAGQILVATLGGLQTFDPISKKLTSFPEEGPDHFKLNNQFVSTLFCDSTGNVWIGTEKGGINKYNIYQNQFNFYANDPNNPNSLNVNNINSILKENEDIWIGTAGGGINRIDRKTGKFSYYMNDATNPSSLSSDYITSMVRDQQNKLWVGTWGGGLNCLTTTSKITHINRITTTTPDVKNDLVNYFVSSLINDPRGFLLIGTEGGLSTLNYTTKKFTTLIAPENGMPQLSEIGSILLDSKNYYWIGTRNGLFRFPANAIRKTRDEVSVLSQLQFFKNNPSDTASIAGNYVTSFLEDSKGQVWIGTYGKGLSKCIITKDGDFRCTNFAQSDGLPNNVVYGIQEDQNGNLWISTDYGLSMLDPTNNHFRNFFKQDGLLNNQFYWSASYMSNDGELFFGGTEGLNYFSPEKINEYKHIPTPKITRLAIFNREINPGDQLHNQTILNKPIYATDTIHLTYRDNNISFDFSAFDYYLPEKIKFAYQLSGIDKEWVVVNARRRFATYSNLDGGNYTFLLKASNCDGIWNEIPTKVTIIITPPFWKTQWFRITIIISVLLLTFFIIQLQMQRIIQQKKILEEKVTIRTQKIEDQKIILEKQADELIEANHKQELRQKQIEHQKEELENKNNEISMQRDELIQLNNKVKEVNQQQLRFFTNISHEFRTPLTLIISPLERLVQKFLKDEETQNMLNIINRNAHRLLILINQLLEIRKSETGNMELQVELTDTKSYLLDIFHSFDNLAQKNDIDYQFSIEKNNVAWLDKEKVENVLYNLLSNAFKFTEQGHQITMKATSTSIDHNDFLCITITDTGIGIPENKMVHLFDRFFQVTESKNHKNSGTGIGLSMVKSLVKIMHGTIEVKSTFGAGSEFTLHLPINKKFFADHEIDTTGQAFESNIRNKVAILFDKITQPTPIETPPSATEIEKILVVEDNHDMRSFICTSLSTTYKILEAQNGKEGYELACNEEPILIISDIMMPEMDGMDFCKKIKNNLYTSHIPFILLTAKGNEEDVIDGLSTGADDYISKPFNINILNAKITGIIENRKKLRSKFSTLEEVAPTELTTSDLDQEFFLKANEIVEKYFTDSSFDVDHFASEMLVSRSQLYKKLKAITNLSANDFINVYRLKKSTSLLLTGNLQISEIAYSTGFNDPKYFSRIFKKFFKYSPTEYVTREKNRKKKSITDKQ